MRSATMDDPGIIWDREPPDIGKGKTLAIASCVCASCGARVSVVARNHCRKPWLHPSPATLLAIMARAGITIGRANALLGWKCGTTRRVKPGALVDWTTCRLLAVEAGAYWPILPIFGDNSVDAIADPKLVSRFVEIVTKNPNLVANFFLTSQDSRKTDAMVGTRIETALGLAINRTGRPLYDIAQEIGLSYAGLNKCISENRWPRNALSRQKLARALGMPNPDEKGT